MIEKAFNIADELVLHLTVENHFFPIASLHILLKLAVLPPIAFIIYPNLVIDPRQMLRGGRDKLVDNSRLAVYDTPFASWVKYIMILYLRVLGLPKVRDVHVEISIFPAIVVPPELHFVFETSSTLGMISGQFLDG